MATAAETTPLEVISSPIKEVFQTLRKKSPLKETITAKEYDYHRDSKMPCSQTIIKNTKKSWNYILQTIDISPNLSRGTLAKLSHSLHLLEKIIVTALHLGWEERSFVVLNNGKGRNKLRSMRPDSCCMERIYLQEKRLLILDVKLSVHSALLTVYKYLPIFENIEDHLLLTEQMTFFPEWISGKAVKSGPRYESGGQLDMFRANNILYVCYLIGEPVADLLPGSFISNSSGRGKSNSKQKKRIPLDMEVKFIPFWDLPNFYCDIGGIKYTQHLQKRVEPIIQISQYLKRIVEENFPNADELSEFIYESLKYHEEDSIENIRDRIKAIL